MKKILLAIVSSILASCGGGGSSDPAPQALTKSVQVSQSIVSAPVTPAIFEECISPFVVKTKDQSFQQLSETQKSFSFTKAFSDKKFFITPAIWNHDNLDITIEMEGCVKGDVATAKYNFNVECCKGNSHASPYIAYGWDDQLFAFVNSFFYYMGGDYKPASKLPVRFDNLPKKLTIDYDVEVSNDKGYYHLTTGLWAYALKPDRTWDCCFKPQPMDIHYWGTPEMKKNHPTNYDKVFTDYQGKTWGLRRDKYWDCDGKCNAYDYTIIIDLFSGQLKDKIDIVPVLNMLLDLGWIKSNYGLKNINIGTEIVNGNATVNIKKFTVLDT